MKRVRSSICIAMLLAGAGSANAANMVVVEAHGVPLKPAQIIDDHHILDLAEGQRVTLITAKGDTITLRGPYHQLPAANSGGNGSLTVALAALLVQKSIRASDVGAVRAGTAVQLPDPWVVDVSHPGLRCIREAMPIVFWRAQSDQPSTLAIAPLNRSWLLTSTWAKGADTLLAPKELPVLARATYLIDQGDEPVAVTLISVPASVDNDRMRAAWMFEKGCNLQAETLAQTLK